MGTLLTTVSTSNYVELQHATIAGYDLAYNKLRKMRKTITNQDGTRNVKDFTILTLVYKARNNAKAYMNHITDGETFTTMATITGSFKANAKGMKASYNLIGLYLGKTA